MSEPTSVTQLNLSKNAFELVALANYKLSIQSQKQQSFQQVIGEALKKNIAIKPEFISSFEAHMPIGGNIRLYVRLTKAQQAILDKITAKAARTSKLPWQRRETLLFLCFALTQKFS